MIGFENPGIKYHRDCVPFLSGACSFPEADEYCSICGAHYKTRWKPTTDGWALQRVSAERVSDRTGQSG